MRSLIAVNQMIGSGGEPTTTGLKIKNLSPEIRDKLINLMREYDARLNDVAGRYAETQDPIFKEEMEEIMRNREETINAILNPKPRQTPSIRYVPLRQQQLNSTELLSSLYPSLPNKQKDINYYSYLLDLADRRRKKLLTYEKT